MEPAFSLGLESGDKSSSVTKSMAQRLPTVRCCIASLVEGGGFQLGGESRLASGAGKYVPEGHSNGTLEVSK